MNRISSMRYNSDEEENDQIKEEEEEYSFPFPSSSQISSSSRKMMIPSRQQSQSRRNNIQSSSSSRSMLMSLQKELDLDESIVIRDRNNNINKHTTSSKTKNSTNRSIIRRQNKTKKQKQLADSSSNSKVSPFLVDLVAENERIEEENLILREQQIRHQSLLQKQKANAKNEIILQALSEANEIEILRKEKIKILQEERRLKALMEIEKTNSHKKQDRIKAVRAERQRKNTIVEYRRFLNKERIDQERENQREILRVKHEIRPPPDNTF